MTITSPQYGLITFEPINAENLVAPIFPGSETLYYENDFGSILIQQYRNESYSLSLAIFNLIKKVSFHINEEAYLLRSQLNLKGSFPIKSQGKPKVELKEGHYILYKGDDAPLGVYFENGKEYQIFNASFSETLLSELFEAFPSLKDFILDSKTRNYSKSIESSRMASPQMKKVVYDLLKCPYDQNLRKVYFENKVNDFLFEMLAQTFSAAAPVSELTQKENTAIFKAREIIANDLTKHFTIKEISQQVHLNEFKLKSGFKQTFGTGIFEYLLQARMDKARKLLMETNKPIKEIAALTGFDYLTNFITSFRKYFGRTPGDLRRK